MSSGLAKLKQAEKAARKSEKDLAKLEAIIKKDKKELALLKEKKAKAKAKTEELLKKLKRT